MAVNGSSVSVISVSSTRYLSYTNKTRKLIQCSSGCLLQSCGPSQTINRVIKQRGKSPPSACSSMLVLIFRRSLNCLSWRGEAKSNKQGRKLIEGCGICEMG